jgi:two-component system sensor histidine kinase DesK
MSNCDTTVNDAAKMWSGGGWRRYFFPAFWLVYLGQTVDGVGQHSHGAAQVIGYVIVAAFAVTYLVALQVAWGVARQFWLLFVLAIGLTVAEGFFAANDALVFCVYLAVLTIAARRNVALPLVVALVLATALLPRFVPGWGGQIDWDGGLTVFLVSFAMYGFFMIIRANVELTAARTEVARLAAENERSRIARDLHDLLGHSLTTITVKAGLARRLAGIDQDRATEEIAAVEQLSRRTLVEVRAAVSGYRDVTLAGELATAREVLRAAGIEASLPGAVDGVDVDAVEPFGWVVREAITNVVRHSRAEHCTVTLGSRWIEITDDGRGTATASTPGNGLAGLRERLSGVGGTITATGTPRGFTVRAELAPLGTTTTDQPLSVDA